MSVQYPSKLKQKFRDVLTNYLDNSTCQGCPQLKFIDSVPHCVTDMPRFIESTKRPVTILSYVANKLIAVCYPRVPPNCPLYLMEVTCD